MLKPGPNSEHISYELQSVGAPVVFPCYHRETDGKEKLIYYTKDGVGRVTALINGLRLNPLVSTQLLNKIQIEVLVVSYLPMNSSRDYTTDYIKIWNLMFYTVQSVRAIDRVRHGPENKMSVTQDLLENVEDVNSYDPNFESWAHICLILDLAI